MFSFRKQSFVHKGILIDIVEHLAEERRLQACRESGHLTLADLHHVLHCLADAHMTLDKTMMTGTLHNITKVFKEALEDMDPGTCTCNLI